MSKSILIIGTLDTKGAEFGFVRDMVLANGLGVVMMDAGVNADPRDKPDITASEVAQAGGSELVALRSAADRGEALKVMSAGASALARKLYVEGKVDGVLSLGGSGGTAIATKAMQALPVGLPKLMVSTMAAGDVGPYVDVKDITMMYSVVDVAGLNRISRQIFSNAVGAISGMVKQDTQASSEQKSLLAASMFGVTTDCVTKVREKLEDEGYEVLVFHATGSGGKAMEALIRDGFVDGVADITTTELCDEQVGGVLTAGPERLNAAAKAGIPQVVSLGALDMVNFGNEATVPEKFKDRNLFVHNEQVTLMRTTAAECAQLGKTIASKLNQSQAGMTTLLVPLGGVSQIAVEGMPFHNPEADESLFQALRDNVNPAKVELVEIQNAINDYEFATEVADRLLAKLKGEK